ncbi:hypothetical protein OUZ56_020440 [Daphnia magna]|uniref:PPPDE domain-containing protein n=1 Tax=Daphnia magna TaxID=35525 RepID=A0ABQ9ZEH7_9CRUS|nr:hypothetical protein OUZ56_020440 [Daphnia magna]
MSPNKNCASVGGNYSRKLYFNPTADQSSTDGYWIEDQEVREKLPNLIDANEKIQNAYIYSNPLYKWQPINGKFYHAIILIQTLNWWLSFEKNTEGIAIQRSKDIESVRDMYQRKKRTTGLTPWTRIRKIKTTQGNNITINELINYIWRKDILNKDYHVLDANCQDFAAMVFDRIKSFDNQVYFDEAADQPPSSTSGFYMTVDKAFDEEKTYWSVEQLKTTLVIHRAKNKDVLLNECQRQPRCTSLKVFKREVGVLEGFNDMNKMLWRKDIVSYLGCGVMTFFRPSSFPLQGRKSRDVQRSDVIVGNSVTTCQQSVSPIHGQF